MDIFFLHGRLWITSAILLAALAGGCSRREGAKAPPAADPDEQMVAAFEEMARLADRYGSNCERWADEQVRALGNERIAAFNERLLSKSELERTAFHTKYAARIDPLLDTFRATSERCKDELTRAALRPLSVPARPDGGVAR